MSSASAIVTYAPPEAAEDAVLAKDFVFADKLDSILDKLLLAKTANPNKTPGPDGQKLHGHNVFFEGPRKMAFRVIVHRPFVPAGMVDAKTPTGTGVIGKLNDFDALQAGLQIVDREALPVLDALRLRVAKLVFDNRTTLLGDSAALYASPGLILAHLMQKASIYKMGGIGRTAPIMYVKAKGWGNTFVSCDVVTFKEGRGYANAKFVPRSLSTKVANAAVFGLNLYDAEGNKAKQSAVSVRWHEDDSLTSKTSPVRRDPDTHAPLRRRVGPADVTTASTGIAYVDMWGINLDDKGIISFCINLLRLDFDPAPPGADVIAKPVYDADAEFDDTDAYLDRLAVKREIEAAAAAKALEDAEEGGAAVGAPVSKPKPVASEAVGQAFLDAVEGKGALPLDHILDDEEFDAAANAAFELGLKRARASQEVPQQPGFDKKKKQPMRNTFSATSTPANH